MKCHQSISVSMNLHSPSVQWFVVKAVREGEAMWLSNTPVLLKIYKDDFLSTMFVAPFNQWKFLSPGLIPVACCGYCPCVITTIGGWMDGQIVFLCGIFPKCNLSFLTWVLERNPAEKPSWPFNQWKFLSFVFLCGIFPKHNLGVGTKLCWETGVVGLVCDVTKVKLS